MFLNWRRILIEIVLKNYKMKKFIKIIIIFVYIFLSLFVGSNSALACGNLSKTTNSFYAVLSNQQATIFNNKKEKTYIVFQNKNSTEISNTSNRQDHLSFGSFGDFYSKFSFFDNYIIKNEINIIYISHILFSILKNTIYTRAP